jgi:hypothetical protein
MEMRGSRKRKILVVGAVSQLWKPVMEHWCSKVSGPIVGEANLAIKAYSICSSWSTNLTPEPTQDFPNSSCASSDWVWQGMCPLPVSGRALRQTREQASGLTSSSVVYCHVLDHCKGLGAFSSAMRLGLRSRRLFRFLWQQYSAALEENGSCSR